MDIKESDKEYFQDIGRHPWELARFRVIVDMMKSKMDKSQTNHGAILDIGCGDMFFLSSLSAEFPQMTLIGVDPALEPRTLDKYQSEFNKRNIYLYRDLQEIEIKQEFSFVLLLDVLEHIKYDVSFLTKVKDHKFISENSVFIITVPAFQSLFCSHDTFLEHFRRYNNDSIAATVQASGLEIASKGYFFLTLLFPRIITVLTERISRSRNSSQIKSKISNWTGNKTYTSLIKWVLIFDFRMAKILRCMGINTIGLSNFIICRKRTL